MGSSQKENEEDFLIRLLELDVITADGKALITKQDESVKKRFWSEILHISVKEDAQSYLWALSECRKYGVIRTYLGLLFDAKDLLGPVTLYEWFVQIPSVSFGEESVMDTMTEYYLEETLECLQERYLQDEEKCSRIAGIERMFGMCLQWEKMRCVQMFMKKSPVMYAQMAEIELDRIEDCGEEYVDYGKESFGFGNVNKKVVLQDGYWLEIGER